MNITRENLSELDLLIKIEVVENDYAEKVATSLKEYQKKAPVPALSFEHPAPSSLPAPYSDKTRPQNSH